METPKIAVAIVNWNSARDTLALIHELDELYPNLPVVVVDNGSENSDRVLLREGGLAQSLFESGRNLGYGGGMNIAVRILGETGVTHAWLFNPDARPTAGSLESLLAHLDGAVALSPRQATSAQPEDTYCSAAFKKGFKVSRFTCVGCARGVHDVDIVTGTGLLVSITDFESVGGFDESYFHYKEEFDLVDRMAQEGDVRLVCSALVVHERGGSLSHDNPRAAYYQVRNELIYIDRANEADFRKYVQKLRWTSRTLWRIARVFAQQRVTSKRERCLLLIRALIDGWRRRGGKL